MIRKLRKLAKLAGNYASVSCHGDYYSVYDSETGKLPKRQFHTYPKTYRELLDDLDKRIALLEASDE